MIEPKTFYRRNKSNTRLRNDSYKLFIDKYTKGLKDPDGFKLNERELVKPNSKNFFIPGKIYTYKYDPLYKDILSYYDTRPIIMCHNTYRAKTGNDIIVGVNLNFLPESIKVGTLQIFYEKFKDDIEKNIQDVEKRKISASVKLIKFLKDWLFAQKLFRNSNIHMGFAYRQYIRTRIQLPSLVEYDDWNLIPFIRPEHIMGKGIGHIYNEYKEYRKKQR